MQDVTNAAACLPPELLALVFQETFVLCTDDRTRSESRAYLSATCSRWRAVALDTRILWSSIYLNTTFGARWPAIIDTALERSGTQPVTVTIIEPIETTFPQLGTRLFDVMARSTSLLVGGYAATLLALEKCLARPAPELAKFMVSAFGCASGLTLSFFPSAPKLEVLYWAGFQLIFPRSLPALACVSLAPAFMDELLDLVAAAPNFEDAVLRFSSPIPVNVAIPSLLGLDLTCPDPNSVMNLHVPALETAVLNFTTPGMVNLAGLETFLQLNCSRVFDLKLSFAGDFTDLAAALKRCKELSNLELGDIGWSTSYVASFLRDMACTDDNGDWVCDKLETLTLRVVQLESAVRTALVRLAETRRASVSEGERPSRPLRTIKVLRCDQADDVLMPRRTKYAALNAKLHGIMMT
ncbi:hypothetical protein AURDEDRAFT_130348 [Auricularia subglabra TFB-10046 SS5]|nr:hypothetical protein AURDEDRAFT_130348 [Auricularia subglabra TFB-10046 SS5]